MTRKKVKLAYIANDSERKASFKKRKKGLLKKVQELSILCGIDVFVVIYNPFTNEPEVWPPSPDEVQRVLARFKSMPDVEQGRKMVNQEGFIRQRIRKIQEQLKKHKKENRQKEVTRFMYQCLAGERLQNFSVVDMNDMGWVIGQTLRQITQKLELIRKQISPELFPIILPVEGNGKEPMMAQEMPMNEMHNTVWETNVMRPNEQPGNGIFGWDEPVLPYMFNNDGAGPSFNFPN